ncbi:MAG: tRNA (cytidine(34)-2'-O)-methyltransferase [Myxococcota bacterium]
MRPEIGPNTGNIGRLCLGLGAALHLVHPLGFRTDDKAVRRAGLDYWKHVNVTEHADENAFWQWADQRRVHLFSTKVSPAYTTIEWQRGDVLLFGAESKGLPEEWLKARGGFRIPMPGDTRSLNLSNAVAVVAYHALQHLEPTLFSAD